MLSPSLFEEQQRPLVLNLRETARSTLATVVPPGTDVALVNFPNHGNPGDPLIWLGTRALLKANGNKVAFCANWACLDEDTLRRRLPDGPVLINGGGNFGDLYRGQQSMRERLLTTLKDRPIIQMPQSIWFKDQANATRMAALVTAHPRFTMMVREGKSA